MKNFDFDLFIIGAGSAGVRAARVAAGLGASVAIAEERYLGGTCVNVGCVPKKLMVYASHYAEDFTASQAYGWKRNKAVFNWQEFITGKNREIERLNQVYRELLKKSGVRLYEGRAILTGPHNISVDGESCTAETILIATGGWPTVPDVPGKDLAITSNQAFFLEDLPGKITIVGGGYIGVEFAGIFHGLGVDTSLLYRGPLILNGFDIEAREFLSREIQIKGIKLRLNTTVKAISESTNGTLHVELDDGSSLATDKLMFATGRHPNSSGIGLEQLGIIVDSEGAIMIDDAFQSSVPSVYAIGDVTNRYNLTPVALAEGMAFAHNHFGNSPLPVDYDNIPTCVFSQPGLASVGLTELAARERHQDAVSVYTSSFTPLKHSLSGIPEQSFMKLVVEKSSDRVIGAHMVGEDAGEIIQGIAIAMKAGARKADFDSTIAIHPTAAEEFVTMRQANP